MQITGRRILIAGSADLQCDERKLLYAHELVALLTAELAGRGAIFLVPFGKEPLLQDRVDGPSIVFDWLQYLRVF